MMCSASQGTLVIQHDRRRRLRELDRAGQAPSLGLAPAPTLAEPRQSGMVSDQAPGCVTIPAMGRRSDRKVGRSSSSGSPRW